MTRRFVRPATAGLLVLLAVAGGCRSSKKAEDPVTVLQG